MCIRDSASCFQSASGSSTCWYANRRSSRARSCEVYARGCARRTTSSCRRLAKCPSGDKNRARRAHHLGAAVNAAPLSPLLDNVNVASMEEMPSPEQVQGRLPLTESAARTVLAGRQAVRAILDRKDPRLFVVVGPCSIHDPKAALDYAARLRKLADEVRDTMVTVMRVYFE